MQGKDSPKSWLILVAVTFMTFFVMGTIKSFGILVPALKEQLNTDTWIVGSCVAVILTWGYIIGLTTNALETAFGPRAVVIAGGVVSNIGLLVCACATHAYILLAGVLLTGVLLIQENVILGIVPRYFDKHYKIAVSVYSCGTALGIIVMPLATQMFLSTYGLRGALFIITGLGLHTIPCGALLESSTAAPSVKNNYNLFEITKGDIIKRPQKREPTFWENILRNSGVQLLYNLSFVARVLIPGIVYGYVFTGWLIYIVSFTIAQDLSMQDSSTVASCGGIGVLAIRMLLPVVHKVMTCKQLLYTSSLLMASSFIATTMLPTFIGLVVSSIWFGIGVGILGAEIYIAAKDVADESEYINVIVWFHLFFGFASLISGSITGLIYDLTTSFTASFSILAGVSLLTAISLGFEDIWRMVTKPPSI